MNESLLQFYMWVLPFLAIGLIGAAILKPKLLPLGMVPIAYITLSRGSTNGSNVLMDSTNKGLIVLLILLYLIIIYGLYTKLKKKEPLLAEWKADLKKLRDKK